MEIRNFDDMMKARKRLETLNAYAADLDDIETVLLQAIRKNTAGTVGKQLSAALVSMRRQLSKLQAQVGAKREITAVALNKWRDSGDSNYSIPGFSDAPRGQQTLAEAYGFMAYEEDMAYEEEPH